MELKDTERAPGHTNRVFAVKYAGIQQPNILLSGGWDRTIQIWDTRAKEAIGSIYGPEICGEGIDFRDNVLLTGSWRDHDQLQLWDFGTRKKISNIVWDPNPKEVKKTYVYTAQFSKKSNDYIIAGASGTNDIRIFDRKRHNKIKKAFKSLGGCFSLDYSNDDKSFAYGGSNKTIGAYEIKF